MSDELVHFFGNHPFWAILVIIFMALPIAGAIMHIVLKAFGHRGIDNTPSNPIDQPDEDPGDEEHSNHKSPEDAKKDEH